MKNRLSRHLFRVWTSAWAWIYSPACCLGKRRPAWFLLLFCLGTGLPLSAQAPGRVVISHASQVALSRVGVHTHANFLLFDTGKLDILAMQRDPARYPKLTLKAHSSLPTDRAALPPDLAAFRSPTDPPLENPYGPIDGGPGKSGWNLLPFNQSGRHLVKVLVPTRFANWLAAQPPTRRRQYLSPKRYTLTVTWG